MMAAMDSFDAVGGGTLRSPYFGEEHEALRDQLRRFVTNEVKPHGLASAGSSPAMTGRTPTKTQKSTKTDLATRMDITPLS